MHSDDTEIDWVVERLPDAVEPDDASTDRARQALMAHMSQAEPQGAARRKARWRERLRPPPRRRAFAFGLATAAVAAAVVVGVNLTGGGSSGSSAVAQAATIKARARAVISPAPGSILEADIRSLQTNSTGPSDRFGYAFWSTTSAPWTQRIVQTSSQAPTAESAVTADGRQELYDPSTNTIDVDTPRYDFIPGAQAGTFTLKVAAYELQDGGDTPAGAKLPAADTGTTTLTLTAAQVQAMKTGRDAISYRKEVIDRALGAGIASVPYVQDEGAAGNPAAQFTAPIRKLLDDPNATVNQSASFDGRPAIEIASITHNTPAELKASHDLVTSYWVAPGSYRPLQEIGTSALPNADGHTDDVTVTVTFSTWRTLSGSTASTRLLSLTAAHPTATTVDIDQAHWSALQKRLYPLD